MQKYQVTETCVDIHGKPSEFESRSTSIVFCMNLEDNHTMPFTKAELWIRGYSPGTIFEYGFKDSPNDQEA